MTQDWRTGFDEELIRAGAARAAGNEGRARVCARRAAGMVVREFYARQGQTLRTTSAYDLLRLLKNNSNINEAVRQVAGFFLLTVTEEWKLPVEADLIREAGWLAQQLLG